LCGGGIETSLKSRGVFKLFSITAKVFFPDFVIGIDGRRCEDGGLLADPKFAFETTQELPKTHAPSAVLPDTSELKGAGTWISATIYAQVGTTVPGILCVLRLP
jgi:hypothetical protein